MEGKAFNPNIVFLVLGGLAAGAIIGKLLSGSKPTSDKATATPSQGGFDLKTRLSNALDSMVAEYNKMPENAGNTKNVDAEKAKLLSSLDTLTLENEKKYIVENMELMSDIFKRINNAKTEEEKGEAFMSTFTLSKKLAEKHGISEARALELGQLVY